MLRLLRVRHLLLVAVVLFAMGAAYNAMHTTQGIQGALNDKTVVATDYRAGIVDVEALLFSPEPISLEDRLRLSKAFEALRRELDARGGSNLTRYSARELHTLAGLSQGPGPLRGDALERVRTHWMRVRSNTFSDEAWFRFSEADPVPQREGPSASLSPSDHQQVERIRGVLARIEQLAARGEADLERLGEPRDDAAFGADWQAWADGWNSEADVLRGDLRPEPAPESATGVRFAHTAAIRAIVEFTAITTSGGIPTGGERKRHFQNAAKQVRDARFWLDRAEKGLGV